MNPADHPEQEPHPGADNYQLGREIAQGGMGTILEARDRKLSRTVAVKVLMPDSDMDEAMFRRFVREATVLAQLEHPNIVPIHDIVWEGGMPLFYTMKLVKGRTLHAILDELRTGKPEALREFTLDRLLTIFRKVCDAVAFAHSRGILHRDLKPENIMAGEFGEVLVMDWGVAKIVARSGSPTDAPLPPRLRQSVLELDREMSLTGTLAGAVIGTPHFMSPEQARGAVAEHDDRSDIFSLGAILYAILTLRPPVCGTTMEEVLQQIASARITPPTGAPAAAGAPSPQPPKLKALPHCPGGRVPTALSAVTMKALALEKPDRFQSVTELAADIDRYQHGFATRAEHAGLWREFLLLVRRHKGAAALTALLIVMSVGLLFKVMASERRAQQEKETARRALVHSSLSLAEAELRDGNAPAVRAALNEVPADLRDAAWSYLLGESDTSRPLPETGLRRIDDLTVHPAEPGVFLAAGDGNVIAFRMKDGTRSKAFAPGFASPSAGGDLRLAINAAGDRIAVGRAGIAGVAIHNANDGRKLTEWNTVPVRRLEFSPDGSRLLVASHSNHRVEIHDAASGSRLWQSYDGYKNEGRFTGGGTDLISYTWAQQLHLLNGADPIRVTPLSGNFFTEFAVRAGGDLAVAGNVLGTVKGFELAGARQRFEFQPHGSRIERVAFLPGGERFLTAATLPDGRQLLQCWDAATGRLNQSLAGGRGGIRLLALHPLSGELAVIGPDGARVWETTGVPPLTVLRSGNPHPSAVFWGSDDLIFAPGPGGNSASLQAISSDGPVVRWNPESSDHGQPGVSADGKIAAISRYNSVSSVAVLELDGTAVRVVNKVPIAGGFDYLRLSPKGDRVAVVINGFTSLSVASAADGGNSVILDTADIVRFSDAAWLSGGKTLAALVTMHAPRSAPGSVEMIVLWDTITGQRLKESPCRGIGMVMCSSPDGARFAESGADRAVRIRDAATLEVLREFRAHNGPITAMTWHPSRSIVATGAEDLAIRVWNVDDGTRLEEIRGPLSPPTVLSFSAGGTRLATASRDGAARVWEPRSLALP
jgi:serine/threonine protein kinase/WD40 repeat protein